jgi:hypothetical protein
MVPLWVTITLGAFALVGPLVSAWVTQWLTTRREANRDALRWAQERQQRELDSQKTALSTSLTALHKWHNGLTAVNLYLGDPYERKATLKDVAELEMEARHAYAEVRLLCSNAADLATLKALNELFKMNHKLRYAVEHFEYTQGAHESRIESRPYDGAMRDIADVYREELAKLSAEPVEVPRTRRKRLKRGSDPQQP